MLNHFRISSEIANLLSNQCGLNYWSIGSVCPVEPTAAIGGNDRTSAEQARSLVIYREAREGALTKRTIGQQDAGRPPIPTNAQDGSTYRIPKRLDV